MKKVVICQHRLLHYRQEFFDKLREACADHGVELHLVHGQATTRELKKKDEGSLPWAHKVRNVFFAVGGRDILWQPFPKSLCDASLIVLMQESRLLSNYKFLFNFFGETSPLIAYWGHGVNFQSKNSSGVLELWKRWLVKRVDWWFAYTSITVDVLRAADYPMDRVTCLNNAIDNAGFVRDLNSVTKILLDNFRVSANLTKNSFVGVFCGSLYPDKRLDYMINALDIVVARDSNFRLVVIGDGPSGDFVRVAAQSRPWMTCVGVQKGVEKAAWYRLADVIINPGLVGLHILDSFCAGVPMITTSDALHSPEIAYLKNGDNGVVVDGGIGQYADEISSLMIDRDRHSYLKSNALRSADVYTLDAMVANFMSGINSALAYGKK